ncbi:MAG: twin-arginine translocase TatA/TatE family subunit [Duncaniella sp.]|nr:twin-arginine translocase TatA/TatE family subunit [Muribaculum sp.]MCM1256123.1 twin-arginine translocase TatA/TatE family subunit [Duncaniella sp.]
MIPCLFNLGTGEIIIIVIVILLLFGAKRIPELARSVGKGINSFKQGLNEVNSEADIHKHVKEDSSVNTQNKETEK